MTVSSFPLAWPAGWKRTAAGSRKSANFSKNGASVSVADGRGRVMRALEMLKVRSWNVVMSSNIPLRLDGQPRSGMPEPTDPGVVVYWRAPGAADGEPMRCMAVDQYTRAADNLAAIAATLDAMRAIERHGGAAILDRAFMGFAALPAPGSGKRWHDELGVAAHTPTNDVRAAYQRMRGQAHPDRQGGSAEWFTAVERAWSEFRAERGIQ